MRNGYVTQSKTNTDPSLPCDAQGRYLTATTGATTSASYSYDGKGHRVKRTTSAGATHYVYDAFDQLAAEFDPGTGISGHKYIPTDALGSTSAETDARDTWATGHRHNDAPFGWSLLRGQNGRSRTLGGGTNETLSAIPTLFTGKERDAETGLDYFGARYMSSAQGRFTSPDAVIMNRQLDDPQLWNKYAYVGNRPLTYIDPDGKWPFWIHNRIIEEVFGRTLSRADRRILQTASAYVDRRANQDAAHAYQHGMSNALIGQSPEDAHGETQLFIMDQVNQAVQAQISAEGNHPGVVFNSVNGVQYADPYAYGSMFHLGEAVHAATDMYSPTHSGAQPWSGNETAGQLSRHVWGESKPFGNEYAEYLARVEAARVYQLYQKRLEEERKRRQQQQEQENE